jgi:hypothetical protein
MTGYGADEWISIANSIFPFATPNPLMGYISFLFYRYQG